MEFWDLEGLGRRFEFELYEVLRVYDFMYVNVISSI